MMEWGLNEVHDDFGVVVMVSSIEGEPYRWFDKEGAISMMPLSALPVDEDADRLEDENTVNAWVRAVKEAK